MRAHDKNQDAIQKINKADHEAAIRNKSSSEAMLAIAITICLSAFGIILVVAIVVFSR